MFIKLLVKIIIRSVVVNNFHVSLVSIFNHFRNANKHFLLLSRSDNFPNIATPSSAHFAVEKHITFISFFPPRNLGS